MYLNHYILLLTSHKEAYLFFLLFDVMDSDFRLLIIDLLLKSSFAYKILGQPFFMFYGPSILSNRLNHFLLDVVLEYSIYLHSKLQTCNCESFQ